MHHLNAALRAHAPLQPRPALRGAQDGESRHRRRVHRPPDGRPALVATACTRRSRPRKACTIQSENQTLASITFQNYFRMYDKLVRHDRHGRHRGLRVPGDLRPRDGRDPDQPCRRSARTSSDLVYKTAREKFEAVIEDIRDCHERGQPVLVGTTSIENSELLVGPAAEGQAAARGAQRQAARARGRDRRPGRPPEA